VPVPRLTFALCLALAGCGGSAPAPKVPPLPPLVADRPAIAAEAAGDPDEPLVVEAVSLFGEALYRSPLPAGVRVELEGRLAEAQAAADAHPDDPDALLRLGRSLADLQRYREAVGVFGRGAARFPEDPRFLRHRGHRFITIRRFDRAIADLEKAARLIQDRPDEPEPSALPGAEPVNTLHGTIWYHLGVARYLSGDFAGAAEAFRESLARAREPDPRVASSQWLYMSLRRLGREESDAEARRLLDPITNDLAVLENRPYHWLLLMEKGEMPPESLLGFVGQDDLDPSTLGYGVGAWYLAAGKRDEAVRLFRLVLSRGQWMAFGHIAAEAELKRMGLPPRVGG
jgi:tetratricopeptide (TPR) repeat protein